MATGYVHECDKCSYSFKTEGLLEFYRDAKGQRELYGHPTAMSREAEECGIWGLSAAVYCPKCDKVRDVIVVEYKKPTGMATDVWSGRCEPKDEYKEEGAVKCPECGNVDMILGFHDGNPLTCPRCSEGKMVCMEEYQS